MRVARWAGREMQKKEFDSAVEEFNKGAELNPKDPWLHYYLALVRLRAAQAAGRSTEGLPNVMQDLRLVVDWDPEFVQARSMLAMAQLEGGGVHAAMDSMRATIQLAPRNQTYLLNMAQIYMAGKNWDAATALLERLKTSPDPQIAKSATEQLEGLPMLKKYGVLPQAGTGPHLHGPGIVVFAVSLFRRALPQSKNTSDDAGKGTNPKSQSSRRSQCRSAGTTSRPTTTRQASNPISEGKDSFHRLLPRSFSDPDCVRGSKSAEAPDGQLQIADGHGSR